MYIYKTTCKVNGKIYIGQCKKTLTKSKNYLGSGVLIRKAVDKYGKNNFIKEILFETNYLEELNLKEVEFISLFKSYEHSIGYNIALGGGGTLGVSYKNPNAAKYLIEYVKKYGNPIYKAGNRKMYS